MVGTDYDHVGGDRQRKRNVKIHDVDGRRLGRYPIQQDAESYQVIWKGDTFPVRKGEKGPEKDRFYLTNAGDAERLGAKKPES